MSRPQKIVMFQDDLKPDLELTLSDATGDNFDITTATSVLVIGQRAGAVLFNRAATSTSVSGANSIVTMAWQAADTSAVGPIAVEVEITWPGSKKQTIRAQNVVEILADFA